MSVSVAKVLDECLVKHHDVDDNKYRKHQVHRFSLYLSLIGSVLVTLIVAVLAYRFVGQTYATSQENEVLIQKVMELYLQDAPSQAKSKLNLLLTEYSNGESLKQHVRDLLKKHDAPLEGGETPKEEDVGPHHHNLKGSADKEGTTTSKDDNEGPFADKYLQHFFDLVQDEECQSNDGFDMRNTDTIINPQEVSRVLNKCKHVVLRNLYEPQAIRQVEQDHVIPFLNGIAQGRISHSGQTTNGELSWFATRQSKRYEIILPRNAVEHELLIHPVLHQILEHPHVLGDGLVLHSAGVNFAEPMSGGQTWHFDESYLFGHDDSFENCGIAGHDIKGGYAVTVMIPLLDMTRAHGPTEVCLGGSALQGLPIYDEKEMAHLVQDEKLLDHDLFYRYADAGENGCPPEFWKSPLLKKGDALLFDYQMRHRGGWNFSNDTRAVMFFTFSRMWFKDINFREYDTPKEWREEQSHLNLTRNELDRMWYLLNTARLSIPDKWEECNATKEDCDKERELNVTDIFDVTDDFEDPDDDVHDFTLSNKDVGDDNTHLFLNGEDLGEFFPGDELVDVPAKRGDVMELKSGDKVWVTWNVYYEGHYVFTKDVNDA